MKTPFRSEEYAVKEIDPTHSTDPKVRRATFVGATAAAAAGSAVLGTAFAQSTFGQSHPPIVPENDPAIVVEHVELQAPGGAIPAYAATPQHATAATVKLPISIRRQFAYRF